MKLYQAYIYGIGKVKSDVVTTPLMSLKEVKEQIQRHISGLFLRQGAIINFELVQVNIDKKTMTTISEISYKKGYINIKTELKYYE